MFNWAQKNFKRSMNFNKKMFLDDSLKAVKVSVKKDIKGGMDLSGMVKIEEEGSTSGRHSEPYPLTGETGFINGMPITNMPEWLRPPIESNKETKTKTKTKSNSGPKKTITKSKARLKSKNKRYKKNKKGKSKKIKSKNKI